MTADQLAAAVLGKDTPLPSLELAIDLNFLSGQCENSYACIYMNTIAWRSPTSPLPTENNPRLVFERLFGNGGTTAQRVALAHENRSILDSVTADFARLARTLGPQDRTHVDSYLEAVREVERRIAAVEKLGDDAGLPALERPRGIPENFGEHVQADVRAAVARVPGRHHARRHVHARPRAELPHLSRDRLQRRPSRRVAPRRSAGADREARATQHVSDRALRGLPRAS